MAIVGIVWLTTKSGYIALYNKTYRSINMEHTNPNTILQLKPRNASSNVICKWERIKLKSLINAVATAMGVGNMKLGTISKTHIAHHMPNIPKNVRRLIY